MFLKNPLNISITYRLLRLWEFGLGRYWVSKQIPTIEQCTVANERRSQSTEKQAKIKLKDLASAFFILGAGLGAAILSFLLELIVSRFHANYN